MRGNKECVCGGKMIESEWLSFASIRVPDGNNFSKDYQVIPFICEKCGKIELYAGKYENGNVIFGGIFL